MSAGFKGDILTYLLIFGGIIETYETGFGLNTRWFKPSGSSLGPVFTAVS